MEISILRKLDFAICCKKYGVSVVNWPKKYPILARIFYNPRLLANKI
jgi:hypothetical protein